MSTPGRLQKPRPATRPRSVERGPNPGDMAHLAAGPRLRFAVQVQVRAGVAEEARPIVRLVADQVAHLDLSEPAARAERPAAHGSNMLLELGGRGSLDRPMARVVHPRRDLVDDEALGSGLADEKHLDRDHADIAERI